jgi:hypothetical protein
MNTNLRLNDRAFEAFDRETRRQVRAQLGRHDSCYGPKANVRVSTPGFWEPGDGFGVGISQWCCERCGPIVADVMTDLIGGAEIWRKGEATS